MRRLTLGLGLGALCALAMATSAYAVSTEATWTATSTGSSAGGTKAAPAPFSGQWTIKATNNINPSYRAAVPFSWSWSWEGVTVRQKGIPTCSIEAINDAKSTSVCPPGAHVGISATPAVAEFGPLDMAEGPNTQCLGKTFDVWNSTNGQLALVLDGPPEQCATLGFLGAYPITLATSGGKTTMTWTLADNIKFPFPGAEGGLPSGNFVFNKVLAKSKKGKKGKKAKKSALLTSINCKGTRDFTMAVVDRFGTHTITNSAGNCKAPKKKRK
jgi:hypothetical protein